MPPSDGTFYNDPASLTEIQVHEDTDQLAEWIYCEEKDFVVMVEGMEETVTMTYTEFDFANWQGAAKVSMYMDRERYNCFVFEGEYDIVPVRSGEAPTGWIHVFPSVGRTAQEIFDEIKSNIEYNEQTSITEEGTKKLNSHTVLYLTATDTSERDTRYIVYYIAEYDGGCIGLSTCVGSEAIEGHGMRLNAMVQTFKIIN